MPETILDKLKEFHSIYGANMSDTPSLPTDSERELRKNLLAEEYQEYLDGEASDDLVEIADALGDMIYIIFGTAVSYGIPLDRVFREIHDSNMSKLDPETGKPIKREDGKILKGSNYFRPRIKEILEGKL